MNIIIFTIIYFLNRWYLFTKIRRFSLTFRHQLEEIELINFGELLVEIGWISDGNKCRSDNVSSVDKRWCW